MSQQFAVLFVPAGGPLFRRERRCALDDEPGSVWLGASQQTFENGEQRPHNKEEVYLHVCPVPTNVFFLQAGPRKYCELAAC